MSTTQTANNSNNAVNKKQKRNLVNYDKINSSLLSFTSIDYADERHKKSNQFLSYSRYKYPDNEEANFVFVTPRILMNQRGIPKLGEYYKEDDERSFVQIPLDHAQVGGTKLEEKMASIDARIENELMKPILGEYANLYAYQQMVKEPVDNPTYKPDPTKPQRPRSNYFKAKFDIDFNNGKFLTKVFVRDVDEQGKLISSTQVECNNPSDVEKYLRFNCTARFIIMINKFWAAKSGDTPAKGKQPATYRKCGVGMKIMQIEIEPSKASESTRSQFEGNAFGDVEESGETAETQEGNEEGTNDENNEENNEQNADENDGEQEEPQPEPVKPAPVVVAPVKATPAAPKKAGRTSTARSTA